jgi:DNA-binding beta-propeller fold protein YncE
MKMKQGIASVRLYFREGPPISHLAERMTRVVALPFVLVALFSGCKEMPPVVDLMPSFGSAAVSDSSFPARTAISDVTLPEASDGDGALSYTFEPVPPGLSFNAADRVLSGTPTTVDVYDVTYRVADEDGDAASLSFTIAVRYGAIFWTAIGEQKIWRRNFDGSGVVDLMIMGLSEPHGIAVNGAEEKMYWTDCTAEKIQRSNLDGTAVEDLVSGEDVVSGLACPRGIVLDAAAGKMYWTEDGWREVDIRRANLDGTSVEDLVSSEQEGNRDIALDTVGGKMYWTDTGSGKIQRANLDGSRIEELVSGLSSPRGIALDVAGGKIYWAEEGGDGDPRIRRGNLDGTGVVVDLVTTGLSSTTEIELDIPAGKMYWADHGTSRVQGSNLDGSEVEDLVTDGSPYGIALY